MKKILALFFAIIILILAIPLSGCNDPAKKTNPESDFKYEEENGGIKILWYIGKSETVVIPNEIQNLPVTKLGGQAFMKNNLVTSVIMPDTVVEIRFDCFSECSKLESITLSKNLESIGDRAFYKCTSLKHITIPSKTNVIGYTAFESSGLETIVFEEGLEIIGGYGSFARTKIKEIRLPSTAREIGDSAFGANPDLETVVLNEGLVTIGHKAFAANPKLKEIVIPKTVKYVTYQDFNACSGLKKVKFEGNAPETFEFTYTDPDLGIEETWDLDFTVYYHEGATGFTSPTWYGYKTEIW